MINNFVPAEEVVLFYIFNCSTFRLLDGESQYIDYQSIATKSLGSPKWHLYIDLAVKLCYGNGLVFIKEECWLLTVSWQRSLP